ncbi:TetR/AcrR family transcriptional regulator [Roseibium sp.]|uniref:TetR/AcrR family transcriptional regulator n=1 Tax=Roseibium sp. TaxID=1936156 RepID=UPI0026C6C45B
MSTMAVNFSEEPVQTSDRIIKLATELFLKQGYAGTSISALASAAGIQKASLYHHFPSKEAVLFACLQSGYADHVERMRRAAGDTSLSHSERLEPVLDAVYGAIVDSNAGRMVTIIAETTSRFPEIAHRFHDHFMAEMQDILKAYIVSGINNGEFDNVDPMTVDHAMFGVPVNLTLNRAMFAGFGVADDRYDANAVKAHHVVIMRKLLGVEVSG